MAESVSVFGGDKWRPLIESIAKKAGDVTLEIGVLEGGGGGYSESPGLSTATLGFWHEFGTSRMPARPFLREGVHRHGQEWVDTAKKYLEANVERLCAAPEDTVEKALKVAGKNAEQDVKRLFTSGELAPPVTPEREAYKAMTRAAEKKRVKDLEKKRPRDPAGPPRKERTLFYPQSAGHPVVFSGTLSKAIRHEVKRGGAPAGGGSGGGS